MSLCFFCDDVLHIQHRTLLLNYRNYRETIIGYRGWIFFRGRSKHSEKGNQSKSDQYSLRGKKKVHFRFCNLKVESLSTIKSRHGFKKILICFIIKDLRINILLKLTGSWTKG